MMEAMPEGASGGIGRVFHLLRLLPLLGDIGVGGARLNELAGRAGLPRPTTHRLLRALMAEDAVIFDPTLRRAAAAIEPAGTAAAV